MLRDMARNEDWWAVLLGLGLVGLGYGLFISGFSLGWIAVSPDPWTLPPDLFVQFRHDWPRYSGQFLLMLGVFTLAARMLDHQPRHYATGFALLYALSLAALTIGAWSQIQAYNIEAPLIALAMGVTIANVIPLPDGPREAFRVEFYIKIGIVLLGATLPITLVLWAGPIAIAQASIVSITTFLVIYYTAVFLNLERELAALLAVGGSVCGVSAVIAIGGAIRARRGNISIAVTSVVAWSILLIIAMPLLARAWYLPAGVAGAWIGTSEMADAAGFIAAHAYGAFTRDGSVTGTPDQVLWAYTLLKVIGRDMWIGIWAVVLSFVSMTWWEPADKKRAFSPRDIWRRFPKFIIGLALASLLATAAARTGDFADFDRIVRPGFIAPLSNLRVWIFTFSFLSIGLTTRLRGFVPASGSAFIAFAAGVLVNLVLGFFLSAVVFPSYWENLAR